MRAIRKSDGDVVPEIAMEQWNTNNKIMQTSSNFLLVNKDHCISIFV